MKRIYLSMVSLCLLGLSSCFDMDKYPEGELSSVNSFTSTTEITKYLNQFYESTLKINDKDVANSAIKVQSNSIGNPTGIAFGDLNSDNMQSNVIDTRLAGETTLSSAVELTEYKHIRSLNFLINNLDNCEEIGPEMEQCIGEAYFFRACYYYRLFVNYGEVTWLTKVLDPIQEQMERPRNSRLEVADSILADLDIAIEHLNTQTNSSTMRVHKDVARALKSEVALFEGTWEKYHRAKNTPFYDKKVTDEKINSYLRQAADVAKDVIDEGVWSISKGNPNTAYRDLFITLDLSHNPEVLWWKKYDAANNIGHSVTRYLNKGGGTCGASASLVDDYLTKEGKPTWIWNALDKIVVGDTEPKIRGTFGVNVGWKGLYMNATFAYQYGGEAYNQTVVDKVENSNKYQNVDKRVLTETWQKPGDVVKYKANVTSRLVQYFTYASSRFVQDLNYLQFSSFSLQYEMPKNWISCLRMESLRFSFNMSDLFYWSTVKRERGTSYPFARSFTVGLRANF